MTSPLRLECSQAGAAIDNGQHQPAGEGALRTEVAGPGRPAGQRPEHGDSRRRGRDTGMRAWPWAAVATTVSWSLWELRATVLPAQYQDDNSVHEQMVRFAASQIRAGHDPLTSWFAYLGLGSPQFLHYQSTPSILTGLAGLLVGPDTAFRWSLYLLWCLWPVAIYASARVFGLDRPAAAVAAAVAPLLHSAPGIGYEQHAYVWAGYGVWTQMWGSWALPFAWALTWRAMADKRFIAPAAGMIALTAAFHYETGYLAFLPILILPFLILRSLRARLARAAAVLAAALLASAWVVVPLLLYSRWAGIDQALAAGPLARGYGARVTLGWLVTGRLLDDGHLPVVSLLAAAGLVVAVLAWRQPGPGRALVALLCAALLLSFGRTSFGGLVAIIPGHADLFFRRFLMGAQLAMTYMAGLGATQAARLGGQMTAACASYLIRARLASVSRAPATVLALAAVAYLVPAWSYLDAYDAANSADIHAQQAAQTQEERQITAVAAVIRRDGGGRTYAGSPANWGQYLTIGSVPVYKYLESLNIDEVGATLRTASLMTQPEYHFDQANPGDYALFGIRYLILPAAANVVVPPHPGASLILRDNLLRVYQLPGSSYIRVADTIGTITANRADIGSQTRRYLSSALPGQDRYLTVAYAGARAGAPTLPQGTQAGLAGTVLAQHADLTDGSASAVVRLRRRAVVILAASFDPGWSATIDGHPATIQMIAPAMAGVIVPPGTHHIAFRYTGFSRYPELLALAVLSLLAVAVTSRRKQPRARGRPRDPCKTRKLER